MRFYLRLAHRRIGGADNDPVMPGNRKKNTSIVGMRYEYSRITREKLFIEDQVYPLTGGYYRLAGRIIHLQYRIGKYPGGIDHGLSLHGMDLSVYHIGGSHSAHPVVLFFQPVHP